MTTIAAISTPIAAGGIGIVRISGEKAKNIASKVFKSKNKRTIEDAKGYTAIYGRVYDKDGDFDEAVALIFTAPKSYTGEDVVELSCHGGIYITKRLLEAVLDAGACLAGPGEFTQRAFMNGKMDLTGTEAVMDLISARGEQAARAALAAKDGALWKEISKIKQSLIESAAHIAAWIDYPEDDIPQLSIDNLTNSFINAKEHITKLLNNFDTGKILREGVDTVIAGRPNVGKSTLMNLLSGCERSIVTDIPGTTRDIVEETVKLGDIILRLSDTAGLRNTSDPVESIGVDKAMERLDTAQFIIAVFDCSQTLNQDDIKLLKKCTGRSCIAVINTSDLLYKIDVDIIRQYVKEIAEISAVSGEGLKQIENAASKALGIDKIDTSAAMIATERQKRCAIKALDGINAALDAVNTGMTLDAIGVSLDDAIAALLELTGERVTESVVNEVFARFCVGK